MAEKLPEQIRIDLPHQQKLDELHRALTGGADLQTIAALAEQDQVLRERILQLANGTARGLRYRIDTVQHAVTLLGATAIENLTGELNQRRRS